MEGGMSLKEKALLGGAAMFMLYAMTAVLWFTVFKKSAKGDLKAYAKACENRDADARLIGEKDAWEEKYRTALGTIPEIPEGRRADVHMMSIVRPIAQRNNIRFTGEKSSDESVADEMNRLTIELDWTGAYETLVRFMYELESTDRGQFDVTAINFSPEKKNRGYLSGKMTLTCIFRRKST